MSSSGLARGPMPPRTPTGAVAGARQQGSEQAAPWILGINPRMTMGARQTPRLQRNRDDGAQAAHRAFAERDVAAVALRYIAGDGEAETGVTLVLVARV